MPKLLAIAAWPAGLAVVLVVGSLLAWRSAAEGTPSGSLPRFLIGGGNRDFRPIKAQLMQYLLLWIGGIVALYAVMALVGTHGWLRFMKYATQVGYKWTARGAGVTAAVLLTFIWQRDKWVPAVSIISLILTEHFVTVALNHTFNRPGPPGSHGTSPSGGTDRAFAIYGLIAYLFWREASRLRPARHKITA